MEPYGRFLRLSLGIVFLAVLVAIPATWAADFIIPCGDVPGLIAAIEAANSTPETDAIGLEGTCTYLFTAPYADSDNALPEITSAITINGNGATLQRDTTAPDFRILTVAMNGDLTLNHAVVSGGSTGDDPHARGGGIYNNGMLVIQDTSISANTSHEMGGGVYNNGTLYLLNATVDNNETVHWGGGISDTPEGITTIQSSILTNNFAHNGAAIFTQGNLIVEQGTTIALNTAGDSSRARGGGIAIIGGTVTILDTVFDTNTATVFGGAINNADGNATITNATFIGNDARWGGALSMSGNSDVHIQNTQFVANTAHSEGGGINIFEGEATINTTTFTDNTCLGCAGGAIRIRNDAGIAHIANSTFEGNVAGRGGGIFTVGTLDVANSTFTGNEANDNEGGGIWVGRGTTTVSTSTFNGNSANVDGGGVYVYGGTATIDDSTFENNTAIRHGGGISNLSSLEMTNTTLTTNSAGADGGGIWNGSTLTVTGGSLRDNMAALEGNGIWNSGSLTLTDVNSVTAWGTSGNSVIYSSGMLNVNGWHDGASIAVFRIADGEALIDGCNFYRTGARPFVENHGILQLINCSGHRFVGTLVHNTNQAALSDISFGWGPNAAMIENTATGYLTASGIEGSDLEIKNEGEMHLAGGSLHRSGIWNDGTLSIDNLGVTGGYDYAIRNLGALTFANGTLGRLINESGSAQITNALMVTGGDMLVQSGDVHIENSFTIGDIDTSGNLSVLNTSFRGNEAALGILVRDGTTTVTHSTFATNGIGVHVMAGGALSMANSILANNDYGTPTAPKCVNEGSFSVEGGNLSTDDSCTGFTLPNTDPLLGSWEHTVRPLLPGSPAINAAIGCPPPATDQRGVARPQGSACDLGAFEFDGPTGYDGWISVFPDIIVPGGPVEITVADQDLNASEIAVVVTNDVSGESENLILFRSDTGSYHNWLYTAAGNSPDGDSTNGSTNVQHGDVLTARYNDSLTNRGVSAERTSDVNVQQIILLAPSTYATCSAEPLHDSLIVSQIGSRQLRGHVEMSYLTGPETRVTVPGGLINVQHRGPDDLVVDLTYPPVTEWPVYLDPDTGNPVRALHVDVALGVLTADGQYVLQADGSVLTLGPGQDWVISCLEPPVPPDPDPEPEIQLIAPTSYGSCSADPLTDRIVVTGVGSRQVHGRIYAEYITSPTTVEPVPGAFQPIDHVGPDDLVVDLTYPPVPEWPAFTDSDTGSQIRMVHVNVELVVLDSEGQYIVNPDGTDLVLGPGQDWGIYCIEAAPVPPPVEEALPIPEEALVPEATDEPTPEPTDEAILEVTDEPSPEDTGAPPPEVGEDPVPEVTDEPTPEATDEAILEATDEPTPEVTDAPPDAGEVPVPEVTDEPAPEPSEEAIVDVTDESTPEVTDAPPSEATLEVDPPVEVGETEAVTDTIPRVEAESPAVPVEASPPEATEAVTDSNP